MNVVGKEKLVAKHRANTLMQRGIVCAYPVLLEQWYSDTQSVNPDIETGILIGLGSL